MKTIAKLAALPVALALLTLGVTLAQDGASKPVKVDRATLAKDAAERWTLHMAHGKLKQAMELSAVPFAYDRKSLVESRKELEAMAKSTMRAYATPKIKIDTVDNFYRFLKALLADLSA